MTKERNYAVGYKKPPVATRFQKGKSGNPAGRPKATNSPVLTEEHFTSWMLDANLNNRSRRISSLEAIYRKHLQRSISDLNWRSARFLLERFEEFQLLQPQHQPRPNVIYIPKPASLKGAGEVK